MWFFPLNPNCIELATNSELFSLTVQYRADVSDFRTGHISTAEGILVTRDGTLGFEITLPATTAAVYEYQAILSYDGVQLETLSNLTKVPDLTTMSNLTEILGW